MRNLLADNGYLTTTEVARMLDITPRRVTQHAQAGDIEPAGTAGRTLVFTLEDAEALLALRAGRGWRVPDTVAVSA